MKPNMELVALTFSTAAGSYVTVDIKNVRIVSDYSTVQVSNDLAAQSRALLLAGEYYAYIRKGLIASSLSISTSLKLAALTFSTGTGSCVTVDVLKMAILSDYSNILISNDRSTQCTAMFWTGVHCAHIPSESF